MACQADFNLGCYHNFRCLMVNYLVLVRCRERNRIRLDRMLTHTVPNFAPNILIFFKIPKYLIQKIKIFFKIEFNEPCSKKKLIGDKRLCSIKLFKL